MKLRVLGSSGGKEKGNFLPSFLINDIIVLDAGSVCANLTLDEQLKIEAVFISHIHFDHICDLPFLIDNFSIAKKKLNVFASFETIESLKKCVFNNITWPDFTTIPNNNEPSLILNSIKTFQVVKVGDIEIKAFPVLHTLGSVGFLVKSGESVLAYTADTYNISGLKDFFKKEGVNTLITECSFPDNLKNLAEISKHFSVSHLKEQLNDMSFLNRVYIFHIKPHFYHKIKDELNGFGIEILNVNDVLEI